MKKNNKITAIIPLYNGEKYIKECIDSILNQTYENFEIIVINDGSTDSSPKIIKNYEKKDKRVKLYSIENNGAGYARNYGMKKATGEYIMFIDGDDFIEPVTFEVAIKRIVEDKSDFVYMDWKYYMDASGTYVYHNIYEFFKYKTLSKEDHYKLIKVKPHYSVNKLYSRNFLEKNDIKYGEHHIYEDSVFWIKCILKSETISILHSPLYNIRANEESTTKVGHQTTKHATSFIEAYDETIPLFKKEEEKEKKILIKNLVERFAVYYNVRTPKEYQKKFLNDFYTRLKKYGIDKIYKRTFANRVLKKTGLLQTKISFEIHINRLYKKLKNQGLKNKIKRFKKNLKGTKNTLNKKIYEECKDNLQEKILFMGFDYRYTGNSRYLYEKMLKNTKYTIYFATEDDLVDESHKVIPHTEKFYRLLYTSKIVIFESWISGAFKKPEGSIWINLWHGTPLKKMLFDSNEAEILSVKKNHKSIKFNSIGKMDYLLTDNKNINHYFETSFLYNKDRILSYGYPRVEYLLENKNNTKLKREIREKLGVSPDKKIISYLPTWRDYNYENANKYDFSYFLDIEKFKKKLPKNYELLCKDHTFLSRNEDLPKVDIETQELLLVSDYLITDYSSIMFDAFAMDIPVCIIAKDYEKYSESRGLYDEIWKDLKPFVSTNESELAKMLLGYKINKSYTLIKDKYCYKKGGDLVSFIEKKLKEDNNNNG